MNSFYSFRSDDTTKYEIKEVALVDEMASSEQETEENYIENEEEKTKYDI